MPPRFQNNKYKGKKKYVPPNNRKKDQNQNQNRNQFNRFNSNMENGNGGLDFFGNNNNQYQNQFQFQYNGNNLMGEDRYDQFSKYEDFMMGWTYGQNNSTNNNMNYGRNNSTNNNMNYDHNRMMYPGGKKKLNRMEQEAYTSARRTDRKFANIPLRRMPMQFLKSETIYDPSNINEYLQHNKITNVEKEKKLDEFENQQVLSNNSSSVSQSITIDNSDKNKQSFDIIDIEINSPLNSNKLQSTDSFKNQIIDTKLDFIPLNQDKKSSNNKKSLKKGNGKININKKPPSRSQIDQEILDDYLENILNRISDEENSDSEDNIKQDNPEVSNVSNNIVQLSIDDDLEICLSDEDDESERENDVKSKMNLPNFIEFLEKTNHPIVDVKSKRTRGPLLELKVKYKGSHEFNWCPIQDLDPDMFLLDFDEIMTEDEIDENDKVNIDSNGELDEDALFDEIENGDILDDDHFESMGENLTAQETFDELVSQLNSKILRKLPSFDYVSDEEQIQNFQIQWMKDKIKKSQRKKERALLRAEGKNTSKANSDETKGFLKNSYSSYMTDKDVTQEFHWFMQDSEWEQMCFPPMDKHARMLLNSLARRLHMISRYEGKGKYKSTVVNKCGTTIFYDNVAMSMIDTFFDRERKYFPIFNDVRIDPITKKAAVNLKSNKTKAHHKEGELVGQHAPEIHPSNIGRVMLEKMGWSAGMSLGVDGRVGLAAPLMATVKISKKGIGN